MSSFLPDTVSLGANGIIDDFSYAGSHPDTSLWLDSAVYINKGYGISPISLGVATFDGLAANGFPYNFVAGVAAQPADTLTSKPIDLNYPAGDSVYLSFYYQPQGLGNDPQPDDSLLLEFKAPGSSTWMYAWSKQGGALTASDTGFKLVMIPIRDTSFLKKGFQFRFRNYATVSANADQWNLDYVYLNRIRTANDTVFADVAWVYEGTSLLKKYTAMPWKQYTSSEIRTGVNNLIRNNDAVLRNLNYNYKTYNLTTATVLDSFNGNSNILPFATNKRYTDCDVSLGCIDAVNIDASKFPASVTAPTQLAIKHYYSMVDLIPENDTLLVVADLSNYFAYDDGTAEKEVGLVNALDGKLALQFKLGVADTLGALDIYFDPFITNATLYGFYLNVWSDNGGSPGSLIYKNSSLSSPVYEKKGPNVFSRYYLDAPLLLSSGTYYVGFIQKATTSLNIGLDLNNNSQTSTFINVGTGWQASSIAGAIMMRPLFGNNIVNPNAINDYASVATTITVYPNPASDKLYLRTEAFATADEINYEITDVFGKTVLEDNYSVSGYVDVSGLSGGIYFIRVTSGTEVATNKFIKIN
jgi:hypothetical protein